MRRRDFLKGLAGTLGVAALPVVGAVALPQESLGRRLIVAIRQTRFEIRRPHFATACIVNKEAYDLITAEIGDQRIDGMQVIQSDSQLLRWIRRDPIRLPVIYEIAWHHSKPSFRVMGVADEDVSAQQVICPVYSMPTTSEAEFVDLSGPLIYGNALA